MKIGNMKNKKSSLFGNEEKANEEAFYNHEMIPPKMRRSSNESGQQKSTSDFKIEHHHRRSSSNENFVQKVDNLNIEQLLEGEDEEELSQLEFTGNQFSSQLDHQFLKEFNKEILSKALLQNEEGDIDTSSLNSKNIDQMLYKEETKSSIKSETSEILDDVSEEKPKAFSQNVEKDLKGMKPTIELP
jgi:hypothetical protein